MTDQFVHLHNHSYYSLLDGLRSPTSIVDRAVELGQPAVALTDHGSLSGAYELYTAAKDRGIKPIIGCEFYIAPKCHTHKEPVYFGESDQRGSDVSGGGKYGHITVLARNSDGLRTLFRLQELAFTEGFYGKPRICVESLCNVENREDLIVLSGCAGGIASTYVRLGQYDNAGQWLLELRSAFPNLHVEVMDHGIDFEPHLNSQLLSIAENLALPPVVTNDAHYCSPGQSRVHSALLCIQTRSKLESPKFQFDGHEGSFCLQSAEAMGTVVERIGAPDTAASNTVRIADTVGDYEDIFEHRLRMPVYPYRTERHHIPSYIIKDDEYSGDIELRFKVESWLTYWRDDNYRERARYELDIITSLGFSDYFLVVADIVSKAKGKGIWVGPGRGSAGGSLVAYTLGITELDPLKHGLLFERFINPQRIGLPDFDLDIQEDRRDELLDYVVSQYGDEYVAMIGTFGTIGAKAALKDSARVLGYPYKTGEQLVGQLPPAKFGRQPTLNEYTGDNDEVYQLAVELEGAVRSESVHAAAMVISPERLSDFTPVRRQTGKGRLITGFDMHELEDQGLVKTDLLGLRNLKVVDDCVQMLQRDVGDRTHLKLPTDPGECNDPATYRLLSGGNTLGVFQLDGSGMRGLLKQVCPESFGDITAVLALYRPGPMGVKADRAYAERKSGRRITDYVHSELSKVLNPILSETYGLIVYQEQVLKVLSAVADYDYASAELIFNAMRKKQRDKMEAAKPDFTNRMKDNGYSNEAIETLWDTLVPFADYSFNRSHSTGYAVIAYWTAYLKANYPKEYMAALLAAEPDSGKRAEYLSECDRMGIDILPPSVNTGGETFIPTDEGIRYGLAAIKELGGKSVKQIDSKAPYHSLEDFLDSVHTSVLNSKTMRALAESGAFDDFVNSRIGLVESVEDLCERAIMNRNMSDSAEGGVMSRVGYFVPPRDYDVKKLRSWEEERLGVAISVPSITLVPEYPLGEDDLVSLRTLLHDHPGKQPVYLRTGLTTLDLGCKVELNRIQRSLNAMGVTIRE